MKNGKVKSNFIFIVGISIAVIILFSVGFATFYKDGSFVFSNDGYIINATENSSNSYSFASGTKYKTNLSNDIAFSDTNKKSVSVDSASFVHYNNGSLSFLQNGALLDLDKINEDYVPYYNISNKFIIKYDNNKYTITNDTKSLEFVNWIGRISDDKYIVIGKNLGLKIPGVNKTIEGDYFELLFMTDGVVKIDNQEVSYQVTAQGSTIYVGENIRIDLGEGQIFYNNDPKMVLSQITISGNENIDIEDDGNSTGGGNGAGTSGATSGTITSGSTSGISSGAISSGTEASTSSTTGGIGDSSGGGSGAGGAGGEGSGEGTGEGGAEGGSGSGSGSGEGEKTTTSATIELIKIDVTSTSMYATLQMNRSNLISGILEAYLTNISTGERVSVGINKQDGTLAICTSGTDCYSFKTSLIPNNQYLLSIIDTNNNKQYFQKLITTSELGVNLEKMYTTSNSLTYNVNFSTNTSVEQLDVYLYDSNGEEVFKRVGITETSEVTINNLKAYSAYNAVIKNVSVCNENGNCSFDPKYEISRTDLTLKKTPVISSIDVKKNVESATFDLSATVKDEHATITKYVYTVCRELSLTEKEEGVEAECFTKEKTDADTLNIKVGTDIYSGVSYTYTFKVQYNDGQMEREVISNLSKQFSMESRPYFQLNDKSATSNTIVGKLTLVDPNCTVPINGRICNGKPEMNKDNEFTLRYYKLIDGEEKKVDITFNRKDMKIDSDGLYYYNLNLTNLAAETKYIIKVYGTYYLNGEEYINSQIGDELYAETSSTGNLKFVYTANDSTTDNVINYYAKLSGGKDETGSETESLSALNSIAKLTFDLYGGTYADDSETNNRHLGNQIVITGNKNIKNYFCNTDSESKTCNVSNNANNQFTNSRFGLDSLTDLMKETGKLGNVCTSESFGCLANAYTIVVHGYDSAENEINIDENSYTYYITPSFYVDTQLKYHPNNKSIIADPITKQMFKQKDTEEKNNYDFTEIIDNVDDELKNKESYLNNLELLDDTTIVGIEVFANIPQSYINAAYKYDKVITNYYVCSTEDECNSETAIKKYKFENVHYSNTSYKFYLNDSDFVRGNTYKVMYELVFTASDGTENYYANDYTTITVPIKRQAPIYNFYIINSTANSITYRYNIKDVDSAIDKKEYNFYYKVSDNQEVYTASNYTLDNTSQVTFKICEETCNNTSYSIYLKEKLLGNKSDYVAIDENIFDGDYTASNTDKFELFTYNSDNRLYIKLNDSDLGSRTAIYRVKLSDIDSKVIYDKYYIASKLSKCSTDTTEEDNHIICEKNPGDYRYITVDYNNEKIAANIGKNISVTIDSYYDSGLIGTNQSFQNGLLLENSIINKGQHQRKYLNVYYTTGLDTSTSSDIIYQVSGGSWGIGNDSGIQLYNILDLKKATDYNKNSGANLYEGAKDSISSKFTIYAQNSSVGYKLGNYANYNPKVVRISSLSYDKNTFKFDSIIPKVKATETRGINSINLDFKFDGVSKSTLNQQFSSESGKYYLYINLYNENNEIIKKDVKVEINANDESASGSILFKDLEVATTYKYDIWAYLKNGNTYNLVQVYDANYKDDYVKTTYTTKTLTADELLSNVVFKASAIAYKNNGSSISNKKISYNINISNGAFLKIRLGLYNQEGKLLKFDGTPCNAGEEDRICYIDIADESHTIDAIRNSLLEYTFNNNDFVFGDGYYTLKVFAIPYYSNKGYDSSKELILYNDVLTTQKTKKVEIDVHELAPATFNISDDNISSKYNDTDKYYILLEIPSITDKDYVMKNGEYHITLYDNSGNEIYKVFNENNKTIMKNQQNSKTTTICETACLYSNSNGINIKFPALNKNTQYSIELSYNTYRNNVSFLENEEKKTAVSPYTNYIYTPISEGITLGNEVISKESTNSFKVNYIGSNNISGIKKIKYKVSLKGSSSSVNGTISGNSIFTGNNGNYSVIFDFTDIDSDNKTFNFETSGTYIVTIHYYTEATSNVPIHNSTFSILV